MKVAKRTKNRGVKLCSECGAENGVRAYECKECDAAFKMKKKRRGFRKKLVEDYRTLKKGDVILVVGGSGDYYENEDGERTYFTDRGQYKVMGTDDQGVKTIGPCGYTYLYMGKKKRSKLIDSMWRNPHKIKLIVDSTQRNERK